MWKFQIVMSAILCVIGLSILALGTPSYANRDLYTMGQVFAVLGGIFVVWIAVKRFIFGWTGD